MSQHEQQSLPQAQIYRAQAAWVSFLAAEILGSQVEFLTSQQRYQFTDHQLLRFQEQNPWRTLPGQPTEDGELVLLLGRMLQFYRSYHAEHALHAYQYWLQTDPFAASTAISHALKVQPEERDFCATALARVMPIACLGVHVSASEVAAWAMADTALTQPAALCQQASALYAMMLAKAIATGADAETLYQDLQQWAVELNVEYALHKVIEQALFMPPADFTTPIKPVLCAFHNAVWQMLYAKSVEDAISETIRQGGDTGTNAAVAAALVAALQGMPDSGDVWLSAFTECKPQEGVTGVEQPRPQALWPQDVMLLAEQLITCISRDEV